MKDNGRPGEKGDVKIKGTRSSSFAFRFTNVLCDYRSVRALQFKCLWCNTINIYAEYELTFRLCEDRPLNFQTVSRTKHRIPEGNVHEILTNRKAFFPRTPILFPIFFLANGFLLRPLERSSMSFEILSVL